MKTTIPALLSFSILSMAMAPAGASCPGDADGNGQVDGADMGITLASWGPCKDCAADFDGNGEVDGLDIATLLSEWGPCD